MRRMPSIEKHSSPCGPWWARGISIPLLTGKDEVAGEFRRIVSAGAQAYGLAVSGAGIKDVILPGEMKALMNRVTEARKAAEANLIARREETAAHAVPGQHGEDPRWIPHSHAAA